MWQLCRLESCQVGQQRFHPECCKRHTHVPHEEGRWYRPCLCQQELTSTETEIVNCLFWSFFFRATVTNKSNYVFCCFFFLFSLNRDRLTVKMSIRIIILCPLTVNLKTQKRPDCQSVFISRLNTNSNNKTSVRFNLLQCLSLSVIDVFLTFLRHFWNFIKLCKLISFCICSSNKPYTIRDYIFQIFYSACPDNCFNYSESLRHERSKSRWLFSSEL